MHACMLGKSSPTYVNSESYLHLVSGGWEDGRKGVNYGRSGKRG